MKAQAKGEINLSAQELDRYASHINLEEIGINGQKKLKSSSVLCIGSGGLGSPLLLYLAAAGIGHIGIVDFDIVEESNLQRQVIHSTNSIGKAKTTSAEKRIHEINPFCEVSIYEEKLSPENSLSIIKKFDLICDCTDNFPTRYLINDSCMILNKPNVYGSVAKFEGQVSVFNLTKSSPNYRDLVPEAPSPEMSPSCSEGGVIGVLPGLIGILQATEVIKIITGAGEALDGRLLVIDALSMRIRELTLRKSMNSKKISSLSNYNDYYLEQECNFREEEGIKSVSVKELSILLESNHLNIALIDVRNNHEHELSSIPGSKLVPLISIKDGSAIQEIKELISTHELYVHCKSGARSRKALEILKKHGINGFNVNGGIDAWDLEIINQ